MLMPRGLSVPLTGGTTEPRSLWTVTPGPAVLGSLPKPWGAGGHPERESAGQCRALSLPGRGVLG